MVHVYVHVYVLYTMVRARVLYTYVWHHTRPEGTNGTRVPYHWYHGTVVWYHMVLEYQFGTMVRF